MKLNSETKIVSQKINDQIDFAKKEFLSGDAENSPGNFSEVLKVLERKFTKWDNKNMSLIKTFFVEPNDVLKEYNPNKDSALVTWSFGEGNVIEEFEELKNEVRDRISALEGILENFDLYGEVAIFNLSIQNLDNFHLEVIKSSEQLLKDGHFSNAVFEAFKSLEIYVRKVGKQDNVNGAALMQKVFSAGNPILEISNQSEVQSGFMFLFTGAMKAIRNNHGHQNVELTQQESLEWLAFASALFRQIDKVK